MLEHLLGVESRYLVLGSGSEVALKAKELQDHFNDQGTPVRFSVLFDMCCSQRKKMFTLYDGSKVMCGGGQLAYTILGVEYDSQSGEANFLILDPHYVGYVPSKLMTAVSTHLMICTTVSPFGSTCRFVAAPTTWT